MLDLVAWMDRSRPPRIALVVAFAMLASLLPALSVAAHPRSPFMVAAVFPPWWTVERARAAADAAGFVASVGRGNVVVVYGGVDVGGNLRREGAWAIVDPRIASCIADGDL